MDELNLTINGIPIKALKGEKVLWAALDGQSQQRPATRPVRMIGERQIAPMGLGDLAAQG